MFFSLLAILLTGALVRASPPDVPVYLDKGFWFSNFSVGPQTFNLVIDTGSLALLIGEGLYKPSATSQQTNYSYYVQFNGASQDGTALAGEGVSYVKDELKFDGITVQNFLVGNITDGDPLPGDGVAGFSPPSSDQTGDPSDFSGQGLFETLCSDGTVSPCQFGLALRTDGTGVLSFGEIDKYKIKGEIVTLPTTTHDSWTVNNASAAESPLLVVNDTSMGHISVTFDNGTPNVIGPLDDVRTMLQSVGYNISQSTGDNNVTYVFGTYDCSITPARIGFSFPPSTTVHYIDAAANVLNRTADGKLCTANILGTSTVDFGQWSIGQTWFQGRYVHHGLDNHTISFADLA